MARYIGALFVYWWEGGGVLPPFNPPVEDPRLTWGGVLLEWGGDTLEWGS